MKSMEIYLLYNPSKVNERELLSRVKLPNGEIWNHYFACQGDDVHTSYGHKLSKWSASGYVDISFLRTESQSVGSSRVITD